MVTVTTTYKSGGDKSPSSHRPTKLRLCLFLLEQASVDNKPGLRRIMHDRQAADADALRCRPYEPHSIAVLSVRITTMLQTSHINTSSLLALLIVSMH